MSTPATTIRGASLGDIDAVGSVLGAAFDQDPVLNWMVRDDDKRAWAIETLLKEISRYNHLPHGESFIATDGNGAAVWSPPGVEERDTSELQAIFEEVVGPR